MLLTIALIKNKSTSMMVSETAILPIESKQFLYRIHEENTAKRIAVITGRRKPGKVEILKGLSIGDRVVYEGALRLQDGSKVNILNQNEKEQ